MRGIAVETYLAAVRLLMNPSVVISGQRSAAHAIARLDRTNDAAPDGAGV